MLRMTTITKSMFFIIQEFSFHFLLDKKVGKKSKRSHRLIALQRG